jgi:CheY-like chemotaxis protein
VLVSLKDAAEIELRYNERSDAAKGARLMDRVLLVDDDAGCAIFSWSISGTEGFDVTVVHDGLSAVPKALGGDFSLVVLDVMLPGRGASMS